MSEHADGGAHTGPIKNPKQLLVATLFSFIVPIFVIIGLVYFVVSAVKPAGSSDASAMALGGVTEQSLAQGVAARLQKVGSVEIRDANRPLANGETVFKAQCAACHGTGVAGAPKLGDAAAWGPRLGQGLQTLVEHALKGKGAMAPQGGGDFADLEIARAVAYMGNAGGGKFEEPAQPAAAASAPAETASK
ncbi:c-type cytochrome [Pseudorhodoferax sp. LjRoot39]|uniref:c-type cytochrome n=1 Tax=Pseudorhodoferax sp. LjRoot39 TaxID=3342328 RepID=UPI003ED0F8CD